MALTDTQIRNARAGDKSRKLFDGRGLFLLLHSNGSKYWRLKYRIADKEKILALGVYPDVSLRRAREKRDEARSLVADGIDPAQQRKAEKRAARIRAHNTFKAVAEAWMGEQQWTDDYRFLVRRRLENHLFPELGERPVAEIEPPELLDALKRIQARGTLDTARRVRQLASQVFRYAVAHGLARRDPTADLRGALPAAKPKPRAAITDPRQVGALLRAIDDYSGQPETRAALQLAPLVFVRPGELRRMEWAEIDWEGTEWRIPAAKMKMDDAHIVPLSKQALAVLKEVKKLTGHRKYVFPSLRTGDRPMSENTMNAALRRMGYPREEMSPHGFRAMASSLLHEQGWPSDVIERQLAHAERNKVKAAYARTEHLEQRRKMMQEWADYLDRLRQGDHKVTPLRAGIQG